MKRTVRRWTNWTAINGLREGCALPLMESTLVGLSIHPIDITFDDGEPKPEAVEPMTILDLLRNLEGAARYDATQGSSRSGRLAREARQQVLDYVAAKKPEPQEAKGEVLDGEWWIGTDGVSGHTKSPHRTGSRCQDICRPVEIRFKETPCLHTCPTHRVKP
jgi:hypothetical protein